VGGILTFAGEDFREQEFISNPVRHHSTSTYGTVLRPVFPAAGL
jgi:hypothetical protein